MAGKQVDKNKGTRQNKVLETIRKCSYYRRPSKNKETKET